MKTKSMGTEKLVKLALMTALSVVLLMLVRIPYPAAAFLVYDPADIPIYITAFAFGPLEGLAVTLVVCLIQAFALGGDGVYGFLMHFVATGLVALVIGLIYSRTKTKKSAAIALIIGVILCVITMVMMNLVVTPIYAGMPREAVAAMILPILVPFNLLKAGINCSLTFVLYKRISGFLHNETVADRKNSKKTAAQ